VGSMQGLLDPGVQVVGRDGLTPSVF